MQGSTARRVAALVIGAAMAVAAVLPLATPAGAARRDNDPSFVGKYRVFFTQGGSTYTKGRLTLKADGTGHDQVGLPVTWSNTGKQVTFTFMVPPADSESFTGVQTAKGLCRKNRPCEYLYDGSVEGVWYAIKLPAK